MHACITGSSMVSNSYHYMSCTDMIQRLDLIGFGKTHECITPLNHELMVGLIGGLQQLHELMP